MWQSSATNATILSKTSYNVLFQSQSRLPNLSSFFWKLHSQQDNRQAFYKMYVLTLFGLTVLGFIQRDSGTTWIKSGCNLMLLLSFYLYLLVAQLGITLNLLTNRVVQHRQVRLGFRGVLEVPWGHHVRGDLWLEKHNKLNKSRSFS